MFAQQSAVTTRATRRSVVDGLDIAEYPMNYDKYLMTLCALVAGVGCAKRSSNHAARETSAPPIAMTADKPNDATKDYRKPPEQELQSKLTPLQYKVTQRDGTEPPFNNAYWDNKEAGLYVDVATGEPLFASVHKFDSGTGWPSFTRPVDREHVVAKTDAFGYACFARWIMPLKPAILAERSFPPDSGPSIPRQS